MIVPIVLFLNDVEEYNKNFDSKIGSKRFMKQTDYFDVCNRGTVKEIKLERKLKHF